ncbi:Channel-tunnel spanning the outer membrane and periplasm segregation of daughter chromosomes [uncultured Candidatus Thioglobus sp.]|nr:Channel-tunnel spanning the outer membrane and periplasm segregation of daughter chromosomes [uncultured Candidatus Thioglobus sp.]
MNISVMMLLFLLSINVLALSEKAFVNKVLSQDAHFEKDQIYVQIKQIELDASRVVYAGWNATLAAASLNSYYDIEKDTTSTRLYEKHRINNSQAVGIATEKKFLSNPSILTLSAKRSTPDSDKIRYKKDKLYTGKNAEYSITTFDNNYKINYKYPLFRHTDSASSLKTYHRNILDLEREKLDFYDAQESFLVKRLEQYIDWNFYQKNAEIYQDYQQFLNNIKANNPKDKSKLKTTLLRAKQDISSNDSKLQSLKIALISALNDDSIEFEEPEINTDKHPKTMADLTQYLRKNVRFLLKIEIDKNLKNIDLDYHKNQSLFKLDFNISAEKNDNKGNTLTTKYDNKSILYTAGLNFSTPIGINADNDKNVQVAQLDLRKLNINYDNKLQDILADVAALITGLRLSKNTLDQYQELIKNVEDEANSSQQEYLNKTLEIQVLIDAYQQKRDVQLDYIKALTDYQKSLLKYNDKLDRVLPSDYSTVTDLAKIDY